MPFQTFEELLKNYSLDSKEIDFLPICHTTSQGSFVTMSTTGKLNSSTCKVYNENLIYFFYGKASYIPIDDFINEHLGNEPITLVFDLKDIRKKIHRILPFDSGGFERYGITDGFKKDDFTLSSPEKAILKKLIKLLHTTNINYLRKKLSTSIDGINLDRCRVLKELIRIRDAAKIGRAKYGDQAFSFEIQFKGKSISFKPKFIILPYSFFSSDNWEDALKEYENIGVKLFYYNDEEDFADTGKSYVRMGDKIKKIVKENYKM